MTNPRGDVRMRTNAAAAAVFICAGFYMPVQAQNSASASTPTGFAERNPRYKVQPNDTVEIQFRFTPEFNFTAIVQPDGFISSQITGDVRVGGHTTIEISQIVAEKAGARLKDPEVGVVLKDFVKPHFVVTGEVAKPGSYELRGDVGLIQAIALSGGFLNSSAKRTQVILVRRVDSEYAQVKVYNMGKLMSPGNVREDVMLRPDDMLIVPRNVLTKVEPYLRLS